MSEGAKRGIVNTKRATYVLCLNLYCSVPGVDLYKLALFRTKCKGTIQLEMRSVKKAFCKGLKKVLLKVPLKLSVVFFKLFRQNIGIRCGNEYYLITNDFIPFLTDSFFSTFDFLEMCHHDNFPI